jgi:hypothetical protein
MPETPAEFGATLKDAPFATHAEQLMQTITLIVLRNAQLRTPVKTGLLRRSETTRVEPGGLRGFIGTNVTYAPAVHAHKPFFQQGLTDSQAAIGKALQDAGDAYLAGLAETTH